MRCERCQGCLHAEQLEYHEPYIWRCLNCGWREPLLPSSRDQRYGAKLPQVTEVKR